MKTLDHTPIMPNDRHAIAEAISQLQQKFPVEHAILFGSKARGDDDKFSDIDLLLITSDKLYWKEKKALSDLLFDVGLKYDVLFSFLCVRHEDWDDGLFTKLPIYQEIMRDGAQVL